MSPIFGIVSSANPDLASPEHLQTMLTASTHLGLLGSHTFFDRSSGVALVYRQAATFGQREGDPSWFVDSDLVCGVDGGVYPPPLADDARRSPKSVFIADTYRDAEEVFPSSLDGFFSCFVWNRKKGTLSLCSDRLAHKFLYYFHDSSRGLVVFGSELKPVLAHEAVPRRLDKKIIPLYVAQGMTPAPFTLAEGVRKLLPAERIDFEGSEVRHRRLGKPLARLSLESQDLVALAREELVGAMERVAGKQERLALYFSGGIDSTLLACALKVMGEPKFDIFCISYSGHKSKRDTRVARRVAAEMGLDLNVIRVTPETEITPDLMRSVLDCVGEPIGTLPRALNERFLGREVQRLGLTSVLNGYHPALRLQLERQRARRGVFLRTVDEALAFEQARAAHMSFETMGRALVEPVDQQVIVEASLSNRDLLDGVEPGPAAEGAAILRSASHRNFAFSQYIPASLGLEVRTPFFDTRLASVLWSMPAHDSGLPDPLRDKSMLVEAFADVWPRDFDYTWKSTYPNAPLPSWLQSNVSKGLDHLVAIGVLRSEYVTDLGERMGRSKDRIPDEAWLWLWLSCWEAGHIEQIDPFTRWSFSSSV